jgi:hypothetical protein
MASSLAATASLYVMVDWARLMFVDLDAVKLWQHDEPLDGLADFVFWGRGAETLAKRVAAVQLDGDTYGWRDRSVEETLKNCAHVKQIVKRLKLKVVTDFRPHSHHYQLMEQVRRSSVESGFVTLGEARACGFMTTWGDGIFEVHRDLDSSGRLLRVRIELGTDERRKLMRQVEFRWSTAALVSKKIVDEGQPVRFMYRQAPDRETDSGWRMFSGLESDAYSNNAKNIAIVPLNVFGERDKRVDRLLDAPIGSVFERRDPEAEFEPVIDWAPQDE